MKKGSIVASAVKEWLGKFYKGQFELEDAPRCGRSKETDDMQY